MNVWYSSDRSLSFFWSNNETVSLVSINIGLCSAIDFLSIFESQKRQVDALPWLLFVSGSSLVSLSGRCDKIIWRWRVCDV